MTEKERVKAQRKEYLKNATWKQKFVYFWEFYKAHTMVIILIAIAVPNFIYHKATDPKIILNGIFLNINTLENEVATKDLGLEFLELQEIDTSDYTVNFNEGLYLTGDSTIDYESEQAVWVQCAAGTVDFIVSPIEHLIDFAYQEYYADLTMILSEEQIKKYEPYFLYVDGAVIEEMAAAPADSPLDNIELPDPAKPETMKEPIPVFIDMTQCQKLTDTYNSGSDSLVFGILVNAPDSGLAIDFLDYLMQ